MVIQKESLSGTANLAVTNDPTIYVVTDRLVSNQRTADTAWNMVYLADSVVASRRVGS
jgi:hypothetical protein